MSGEIAHPYTCDCSYRGQPAEHRCCSECGDDWDDCDCAARLRAGDRVVLDGHPASVVEVYRDGTVKLDFTSGPEPTPWFTAPYNPIELERAA